MLCLAQGEKRKRRMPLLLVLMVRAVMVDYVSPGTATAKATDMNPYNYTTAAVQQQRHPRSNMASRNPQDQTAGAVASAATEKPSNSDVTPAVPAYVQCTWDETSRTRLTWMIAM